MTISDLISRLQTCMKEGGSDMQIQLGRDFNTTENAFEFFDVRRAHGSKVVYLVPSDKWDRKQKDMQPWW